MPSLLATTATLSAAALLVLALGAAALTTNRYLARKLRLAVYLFGAFLLLRVLLAQPGLTGELRQQVQSLHHLPFLLAIITALVTLALNPIRQDRLPDRFPAIVQDAIVIGLFLVAATLLFPDKLLAASAVSAVIIGFALQDTLGNAFAGLAIQTERPFRVGHWIKVGDFEGSVTEINWRATRLRTRTGDFVIVPNSMMSTEAITNYSEPIGPSRLQIEVGVSYDAAPSHVKAGMLEAVRQAPLVLASPAPDVLLMNFADSSVIYRARVWIADYRYDEEAIDQVRTAIYYAFKRRGLEIPYPIAVEIGREDKLPDIEGGVRRRTGALDCVAMFEMLTPEERATLARASAERMFGAGEKIVRQGEAGESMFVLLEGSARVYVEPNTELAIIEAGGCIGEMTLLNGGTRTASVEARTDCLALEITPEAFRQIAASNPAALERLAALAEARRTPLEEARAAAARAVVTDTQRGLLAKMRRWMQS